MMNLKTKFFSVILLLIAAVIFGTMTGCAMFPAADSKQQTEKNTGLTNGTGLITPVTKGLNFKRSIRCKWDAWTGEPQYLQVRYLPQYGKYALVYGPMRSDAYNNVYYLKNQWTLITYSDGRYFIKCNDPRLSTYSYYLAGGNIISPSDDENDEDISFSYLAVLRQVLKSEDAKIATGSYYPPYTACIPASDNLSNDMLLWDITPNDNEDGYCRMYMYSYNYGNINTPWCGVLNIESTLNNTPQFVNTGITTIQIGFDYPGGLPNGSNGWTGYWSNQWTFEVL